MNRSSAAPADGVLEVLDDAALRRWLFGARDALGRHRGSIDALNVYPVPDGDTGTNLHLTLDAGLQGLLDALVTQARQGDEPLGIAAGVSALARSTLFAARGNSGVILSQLVAGLSAALSAHPRADEVGIDGAVLADAFDLADQRARRAVAEPVEGTILTVMRAAAQAARQEVDAGRAELSAVVHAAREAGRAALEATPTQLDALARAGVVDAGGAGLVLMLDVLDGVVRGGAEGSVDVAPWALESGTPHVSRPPVSPAYEVMFLLDGLTDDEATALRGDLNILGDSVLVAGDARLRTVHVHTDDPGAAVEAGMAAGRPYGVRISSLASPVDVAPADTPAGSEAGARASGPAADETFPVAAVEAGRSSTSSRDESGGDRSAVLGIVACVQAPRLIPLFEQGGAVALADAPGRRVTPAQIVAAAQATGSRRVVVLPDDADAILAAYAARDVAAEEGIELEILGSRYVLQGLAALAVADPTDPGSVERMSEAAAAVRCGVVATATAAAMTDAGPCEPGDVIGFTGGRVTHVGDDAGRVAVDVVRALGGDDAEIVTLVEGERAAGLGATVADALDPGLDVTVLDGGQNIYDLLIGVE